MEISLKVVDKSDWEEVVDLELHQEQSQYVASNAYSLAEAAYFDSCVPQAIYMGDKIAGFSMYECLEDQGKKGEYSLNRLMVDKNYQGKGVGRKALNSLITEISEKEGFRRLTICYKPENEVAGKFYKSVGFQEIGVDEDGEMIAEIKI
ncbi:GNAT family N-acetyltransferase [Veronia nyctiphanis]|uniref:GNAT family N-acetyltransferase n=1 Tax=Veronia nyctiphanis TaxID=1278244 RepID=A0A4Q0YI80_9GAMM|nr:GNAT family N-acetyltransferase [Veronia nyctiphanis]RXJ70417.1 GNAT family N-acetyltransferase [Veronia nyctiphanis]